MGRCFYQDIAPALRTRSINDNNDFIMEEVKIINPLKGQSDNGWHFEQQVYDAKGIARAVKAGEGSGNIPKVIEPIIVAPRGRNPNNPSERAKSNGEYKQRLEMNTNGTTNTITSVQKDNYVLEPMCSVHPNSHKLEFNPETSIKPISPALRATDYKAPHCVYEPNVMTPKRTEFGKAVRKQYESGELNMSRHDMTKMEPHTDGITNTLTSVQKDNWLAEPQGAVEYEERGGNEVVEHRYRIRKLTPRECFRLMGVDDADIDKLLAANISNTQLYRCAGNSIVVDVLYHIFRKCFCQKHNEHQQQTLF